MTRPEDERADFRLAGPQIRHALDDRSEVVAFDAVAGALIRVEEQVEQGAIEEAPATIKRLGHDNRLGAAFAKGVIKLPQVKGRC